ncbi:MAG: conserved membrane protein of unknown function [Promethearchaeota archaeon]|nr:MAG: conserved membrane protein of unknown function [Candidatus Lokiarchaeota archaeon]
MNKKEVLIWFEHSFLLMMVLNFSIFFWDFFSGSDTLGFGVLEPYRGMPMFYVYVISFFTSLIVVLGIFRSDQFGMGFLIWTPYAIIGFFVEAYFELILNPVLINVWAVVGYCAFGLITGASADLSYKYLKERTDLKEGVISGLTGVIMSLVYYITIIIAIGFFYKTGWGAGSFTDPGSFLGVAYFCLPWMIINAYFGGYTAQSISTSKNKNIE